MFSYLPRFPQLCKTFKNVLTFDRFGPSDPRELLILFGRVRPTRQPLRIFPRKAVQSTRLKKKTPTNHSNRPENRPLQTSITQGCCTLAERKPSEHSKSKETVRLIFFMTQKKKIKKKISFKFEFLGETPLYDRPLHDDPVTGPFSSVPTKN